MSAQHEGLPGQEAADRLRVINTMLVETYGEPQWSSYRPPLDELVMTVLSQHTSDSNTERAYASLRRAFPTWDQVTQEPTALVADAIRCGGLANVKAPRIQAILRAVQAEQADLSLDFLADLPLGAALVWLVALPGVGPKTAACVLLFSLGMPTMPVDTHMHRLGRRLGLLTPDCTAEAAHAEYDRLTGPDRTLIYALHMNLLRHGRTICLARNPQCSACVLAELCPSATNRATNGNASHR